MSEQQQGSTQDVLNMEWDGDDAKELDEEFQAAQDAVEIDMDSDDDVPVVSDDEECGQEVTEAELYGDDMCEEDEFAGINDSLASIEHREPVLSIGICPSDKRTFVTGGQDDVAVVWGIEEQTDGLRCVQRSRLEGHTDSVNQVSYSHDGQYIATGSYDGTVKIWTAATGALLHTLEGPAKEVEWVIWHPKGHAILAGSTDTMAWMWWAPTGKLMQIFAGHAQGVTCGCWAQGGKLICTGSEDRSVIVWNPRAGTPQQHIKGLHQSNIISICSHPESPIIVTGSEDSDSKVVQTETGRVLASLDGHLESVECVAFSNAPAGSLLLLGTASMDGKLQIWDGKTFEFRCALTDHVDRGGITCFKWLPHPCSSFLCTSSVDRTMRIFNALAGQCLQVLCGHRETVLDVAVMLAESPDAQGNPQVCVISGSDDKTCKLFVKPLVANPTLASSVHQINQIVAPSAVGSAEAKASGYHPGVEPAVVPAQVPQAAPESSPTSSPAA
jgi:ribosome assembly protein SQT1